MLEPELEKR